MDVKVTIRDEEIWNVLVTAIEQGCGYWARTRLGKAPAEGKLKGYGPDGDRNNYADFPLCGGSVVWTVRLGEPHENEGRKFKLTRRKIRSGLEVMADKYPIHFGNLLRDGGDAETADVFVQCALFGEVLYG